MKSTISWISFCIFNFLIIAVLGTILRIYAIISLDFFAFQHIREAHSHFAFYGWITALIYFFVAKNFQEKYPYISTKKYYTLMIINQISSYGMLFSFMYSGYFWLSILFSTIALLGNFAYFFFLMKDIQTSSSLEIPWLKAGGFFSIFSSIGIFSLAYLMTTKGQNVDLHRASTYFYLHYQYNGFFLFSCIGLLLHTLQTKSIIFPKWNNRISFYLLFLGTFLGYILSILWLNIPNYLYFLSNFLAVIQIIGISILAIFIFKNWKKISINYTKVQSVLFYVFCIAILLKFFLQFISTFPFFVSIFNNLNLVIAYLHLVLLMGFSLFFIWKILETNLFIITKTLSISIFSLILGIIFNEIILLISGFVLMPNLWGQKLLILVSTLITTSILFILRNLKSK